MKLSERLNTVKSYLPSGVVVADIGADRGELSYALLEEGIAAKVVVSDVSAKSLARAKELFCSLPSVGEAAFRVGAGLTVLAPGEVDYAVFAGMGGLTIRDILEQSPAVVSSLSGLVIQAMGNSDKVRVALLKADFAIRGETLVREGGQYYAILHAQPGLQRLTEVELFAGPCLLKGASPLLKEYLEGEREKATALLAALKERGEGESRQRELWAQLELINAALRIWEENQCG